MTNTLDGTYTPQVGDLVWQQMYSPTAPAWDSSITERVTAGNTYGQHRRMFVVSVAPSWQGNPHITRWLLQAENPTDRRGEFPYSAVESDWCVLELITAAPTPDPDLFDFIEEPA